MVGSMLKHTIFLLLASKLADAAQKKRILLLGSTASFSDSGCCSWTIRPEPPFRPAEIAEQLKSIGFDVVTVDVYQSKMVDTNVGGGGGLWKHQYRLYSLAQYYFWPEGKDSRHALLRGEASSMGPWDYVVMLHDPYILATMPGFFAEGAHLVANEVRKGGATPLLLLQWPGLYSRFTMDHFREVVYRVGVSAGITVVPAGSAWDSFPRQDWSTRWVHPTPLGATLAAASLFSEIFDKSAASAGLSDTDLAEHALKVVRRERAIPHFSGNFTFETPFSIQYLSKERFRFCHTGSSSEKGIQGALQNSLKAGGAAAMQGKSHCGGRPGDLIDFNLGRGNSFFEASKRYRVSSKWARSFGFPMQDHAKSASTSFPYGFDRRLYNSGVSYSDGTDLGICDDMIRQKEVAQGARCVPSHLLWAKMNEVDASIPVLRDSWHMSRELDTAIASYIYTLVSGQCAVGEEPSQRGSKTWRFWLARHIGAETAWRLATLQSRSPCSAIAPPTTTSTTTTMTKATTTMSETTTATTSISSTLSINSGDTIFLKTLSGKGAHIDIEGAGVQARWESQGSWQAISIQKEGDGPIRSGDVVFLRTHTGVHVDVTDGTVQARWEDKGAWQAMIIEKRSGAGVILSNDIVCIKSQNTGNYWDVHDGTVRARWQECLDWQSMRIQKEAEHAVFSGDDIKLVAHTGNLVDVEGARVQARWAEQGLWQRLTIQNFGGRAIFSGDAVFLLAHNGKMLDVQGVSVNANWHDYGSWQRFIVERKGGSGPILPGDQVHFLAHTGNRMEVDLNAGVQCRWAEKGDWQTFTIARLQIPGRHLSDTVSKSFSSGEAGVVVV